MTFPHVPEENKSPKIMHECEQLWAQADQALENVLNHIKGIEDKVYHNAAGNTDTSVLFDFMKGYIMAAERDAEAVGAGQIARNATLLLCAASITRLIRHDDRMRADTLFAQLEKENDQ